MLSDDDLRREFSLLRVRTEDRVTVPPLRPGAGGPRRAPALAMAAAVSVALLGVYGTVALVGGRSGTQIVVTSSAQPVPSVAPASSGPAVSAGESSAALRASGSPTAVPSSPAATGPRVPGRLVIPGGSAPASQGSATGPGVPGSGGSAGSASSTAGASGPAPSSSGASSVSVPVPVPTPAASTTSAPAPAPSPSPAGATTTAPPTSPAGPPSPTTFTVWLASGQSLISCGNLVAVSRPLPGPFSTDAERLSAIVHSVLGAVTSAEAAAGYSSAFTAQTRAAAVVTFPGPTSVNVDFPSLAPLLSVPPLCRSTPVLALRQTAAAAGVPNVTLSIGGSVTAFQLLYGSF